jgi:hypothetical protein
VTLQENHPGHAPSPGRWRLLAAFAILPAVDAVVAFVSFPAVWHFGRHGGFRPFDPTQAALAFAALAGTIGLLVTLSGAIPLVHWLLKRGPVSLVQILIAGLALGNVPFAVYVLSLIPFALLHLAFGTLSQHLIPVSELLAALPLPIGIGSCMGVISAAVFWFAAIQGTDAAARG